MIRKRQLVWGIFLFVLITLSACSNNSAESVEAPPEEINSKFLLFSEEGTIDDYESYGTLYEKSGEEKVTKISDDVLTNNFVYYNNEDKVLYLNKDRDLYQYKSGEEKKKLAEEVYLFDGNYPNDIVLYQNENMDLYIIGEEDTAGEKIASNVYQHYFLDKVLYYLDDDGDLTKYNVDTRKEENLAHDVSSFEMLTAEGDIAYLNDDSMLYYKPKDEDSIRISSDEASMDFLEMVDNQLVYMTWEDESQTLQATELGGEKSTVEIATNVYLFYYYNGGYYYLNDDDNLYKKSIDEEKSTKIASEVTSFQLFDDGIYYLNTDAQLVHLKDNEEKETIGTDVILYELSPDGDIAYLNEDNELFINEKKLVTGIDNYANYYGNIAYADENGQLYLVQGTEEKLVEEDLSEYSSVYFQNQLVYENLLSLEDIAGIWKAEDEYGSYYIEINEDGLMTQLQTNEQLSIVVEYASYNTLEVTIDSEYSTIEKVDGETIRILTDYDEISLVRSSLEEADQYVQNMELEADKAEIEQLINGYLDEYIYAVNYGDTYYLDSHIDINSSFYDEQVNFINGLYDEGVYEEVLSFSVENIANISADVYNVTVNESYNIFYSVDATEEVVEYTSVYTVKRINGQFLITDLSVEQNTI
ncbi:hypothetical protein SAMN04487944_11937 [Gracilibacillus ureilyticus]|uniref:TcaA protein NTF2-like domain-containing protein n=1 Tax=Gracilibacillus ureilyticus TaxID=531814 RepID=A0A1H9UTC4_9BACI|nr:hypothetical protein [Gracilibacillus ureilyticus]SES12589.1 hypothetical protein SAMN04487944_11937 [Gracilibacillus ureilyticus]